MGVTGLWKLIEPCGQPVPVDILEGKILSIDISIWLHQVVKGFQDNKGSALSNAHLLGLFHRLCKLLYFRVKPVFVFDGCTPQLKKDTIARRQQQRSKLNTEADRIQAILLESLAKEKVVQQALGPNALDMLKAPAKIGLKRPAEKDPDEMFKLPDFPSTSSKGDESMDTCDSSFYSSADNSTTAAEEDSSFDESNPRYSYNTNLQAIDVKSRHFLELPADVRHEILVDIKETRKQSSWGRLHELPSQSDDFSTFQMRRLLKRRAVQESLEVAEQEMGGRTLTYAELQNFFTEEGIVEPAAVEKGCKPVSSDEHTRFLLVRDLKKKLAKVEEAEKKPTEPVASETKEVDMKLEPVEGKLEGDSGEDFENNLALAIAMSLETPSEPTEAVYREEDYEQGESLRLSREQRGQLKNAAVGPARAYMIEYAGMNHDEVGSIMDKTQAMEGDDSEEENLLELAIAESLKSLSNEKKLREKAPSEKPIMVSDSEEATEAAVESCEPLEILSSDDSDTDSDLEEVVSVKEELLVIPKGEALKIVVDVTDALPAEDDLFADIFANEAKPTENIEKDEKDILTAKPVKKDDVQEMVKRDLVKLATDADDVKSILGELKKQAEDIKNITLDNVAIGKGEVESINVKSEIIEIDDSDSDSPTTSHHFQSKNKKSPCPKTPSKTPPITEFFKTDYVVKRTPEKLEDEQVPKVKSPFFVKRTPNSRKGTPDRKSKSPHSARKESKASKNLFEGTDNKEEEPIDKKEDEPIDLKDHESIDLKDDEPIDEKEPEPIEKEPPEVTTGRLINEAADILRSQRTTEELEAMASELRNERTGLEMERNRQERMGMSISQRMNSECQELLRLFGIPYIIAPMEAEAQCAFLELSNLTSGTITDDSDIWLFGGQTVYKNFFAQNKHVLQFQAAEIEKSFNCDRKKLIQLACLVGSDYTTGIHGIGAVTALEILASFNSASKESPLKDHNTVGHVLRNLQVFRDWWLASKSAGNQVPGSSARLALRKKLKNIELHEGFPNSAVIEAYLTPKVDDSREAFSWGYPDIASIYEFTRKTFGWATAKTDNILQPVIKKLSEKRTQATLRNYFAVKSATSGRDLKVSKRVQNAIHTLAGKAAEEAATAKKPAPRKRRKQAKDTEGAEGDHQNADIQPSTSKKSLAAPCEKTRDIQLPNTKEIIPQREKDLAQMNENKAKAAKIFKNSAKAAKSSRGKAKKSEN